MKKTSYDVATKVLINQAFTTVRQLSVAGTKERRDALKDLGLDAESFKNDLKSAAQELSQAETEQESAKAAYGREAREDQVLAEKGYRYKLAFDARVRTFMATYEGQEELANKFRFGKLRSVRARSVVYELHITLFEADKLNGALAEVGITDGFMQRGRDLLAALDADQDETAAQKDARESITLKVREGELKVSQMLARLMAADEAIAIEDPATAPVFNLDVIRTEEARLEASRASRVIASTPVEAQ